MASFPGNFICRTAVKLHYRVFLIPWARRNCGVSCAKSRDYSSSSPMKYIPRKSSRSINETDSLPVKHLSEKEGGDSPKKHKISPLVPSSELDATRIEFSKNSHASFWNYELKNHDPRLVSNGDDGLNLGMGVDEEIQGNLMAEIDELIEEPEEAVEDCSKINRGIQVRASQQDVERRAIELLATRAYTALELKKKLQGKRLPLEMVDAVMMNLQERGLINDCLYAETFSQSRWSSSSWGPQRIKQALFKKGVSAADTEKAIKLVFEKDEADEDQDSGTAMSKDSIDHLYTQASKQWMRSQGAPLETRKSRIVRWLQYRGFNWSVIKYVLKKLQTDGPS